MFNRRSTVGSGISASTSFVFLILRVRDVAAIEVLDLSDDGGGHDATGNPHRPERRAGPDHRSRVVPK